MVSGAAQFALRGPSDPAAVRRDTPDPLLHPVRSATVVLASTDPAQPYGAALAWPATPAGRRVTATSVVVLRSGTPMVWFDRRSHHLVTFPESAHDPSWADALVELVKDAAPGASKSARSTESRWATRSPAVLRAAGFVDGYRGYRTRLSPTASKAATRAMSACHPACCARG